MTEYANHDLINALFDERYSVRKNIALTLAHNENLDFQEVVDFLSQVVLGFDENANLEHRLQAVQAIGRIGKAVAEAAKSALSKILTDESENEELRFLAAWALEDATLEDYNAELLLINYRAMQKAKELTQRELPSATKTLIDEYQKLLPERLASGTTSPFSLLELKQLYASFGLSRLNIPEQARQGKNYNSEEHSEYLTRRLSNLTLADYALCWLGILTLQKVEPIWADFDWLTIELIIETNKTDKLWETGLFAEKHEYQEIADYPFIGFIGDLPSELIIYSMIQVASGLISGSFSISDAYGKYCWDYLNFGNEHTTPYQVSCVFSTAFSLIGWVLLMSEDNWRNEFLYDTENDSIREDFNGQFPNAAAIAYCATDLREPDRTDKSKIYPEIDFEEYPELLRVDKRKLQEFWEWWLSEAVPQAWQKALESVARG